MDDLLNPVHQGRFVRQTGHSITTGKVVAYVLVGAPLPFTITVSRDGIDVQGRLVATEEGAAALQDILGRAAKHHTHLKSFAIGETQTILDETVLYNDNEIVPMTKTVQ